MRLPGIDMNPVCHPYPETTMFGAIELAAKKFPDAPAYDFMDKITSYSQFIAKIERAAKAFLACGIKADDVVTICMPNTPQAIICLYALNRIGAVANMVHPLSSEKNITFYLDFSESKMILTLDQFYTKVKKACQESAKGATVIVARIQEELPAVKSFLYEKFKNKENLKYPDDEADITWKDFIKKGREQLLPSVKYIKDKTAVILYSGGTSGTPKGIQLSDFNFNALGMQIAEICGCNLTYGCKFLSVMPIFHGFGLGIGIHTILENGAMCILIPQFTKESYAEVVIKKKPNFIAGVPTLFEALLRVDAFKGADLSFLIGVFSGGDALNPELKKKVDAFFREHNAAVQIREGYGLTECVTASCVTPVNKSKVGSIGLPLRNMEYKIVEPGTFNELQIGEKGEIILTGPTLMSGYMKNKQETDNTLRVDNDGRKWLFTGDLGSIDDEGFVYFHQRIKRMIITSGYNVFPSHVERILDKHPNIDCSCVIGMPDPYKMQKIRAYISLKPDIAESEAEKEKILEYCASYLDVYEMPQEIIFRKELPKTLVGKVAYHTLEKEAMAEADVLFDSIKELLGIEDIDISESFFNLGGNSLKALELKSILEQKGYDIRLSNIFNASDIQSIKNAVTDSKAEIVSAEYSSVMKITHAQQRVYTAQMMSPESTMYNITFAFRTDNVNAVKLEKTVNALIARHESLRTHFENRDGQIMQIIDESACVTAEKLGKDDIASFVRPFNLAQSPLIRVGCSKDTVVFDMHHIISDGGTLPAFFRELNELYMGREVGSVVQYGEFAVTDRYSEENEKYWLSVFADEIPVTELPTDFSRSETQTFNGNAVYDFANGNLHDRIVRKSREMNITPYIFYMACFNILLAKFSGSEDIVVGVPVSGRNGRFLDTVGMFVNTVALRNKPYGTKSVSDFLDEVKMNSVSAIDNQNYPFGELVRKLKIESGGRNPLFDVIFAYQSEEMTDIIFADKKAEILPVPVTSSKCDFTLNIIPRAENVVLMAEYSTDLYKEKTIRKFINAFREILEACLDEKKFIKDINVITAEEKQLLVSDFCGEKIEYDGCNGKTLYSLFEENARMNPEKICIKTAEESMSYSEFISIAENLDSRIRSITNGKKSVIAVIAERSTEMYAAVYGIIRGGNAYLPIDPEYPEERIEYILSNSNSAAVVAQGKFMHLAGNVQCIDMTEFISKLSVDCDVPECAATADDTAYVIYTSGSTGNPKGAKVSHKSAVNRILWMHDKYPLGGNDVILQKTPYTFDVSVWEIFWWGIKKGCLAVSKAGEHFLPAKILEEVYNNHVTHIHFVPSVFDLFLKYLEADNSQKYKFDSVKHVFLSGEALSVSLVNRFYSLYRDENIKLHNLYGPTECAVDVTCYDCTENETDPVPIGKPIYNTGIYIVDKFMNIQPVGVRGELCIGGMNVGQGYIGNEALTAEKFIDNPFADGKLYKTGDVAYYREDGNIIFCGRMDNQIKLNGQRLEIGEIESVISDIPQIDIAAVVVQKKNGNDILTAFYCANTDCENIIHSVCSRKLPSYMIPSAFCRIKKMPLNASGKLDRKALKSMNADMFDADIQQPENETERFICKVFEQILGVRNVGRNSNFFTLGGTSLSVISLLSEKGFEQLSAADVLKNPTPAALAGIMKSVPVSNYSYADVLYRSSNSSKVIVLFPFAGGKAESFAKLLNEIHCADYATVLYVDYLHSDNECKAAAEEIRQLKGNNELYIYSHCVGAAVAYKIISILEKEYGIQPAHFVSGAYLPMKKAVNKNPWRFCPDTVLVKILDSAGAKLPADSTDKVKTVIRDFRADTDYSTEVFSKSKDVLSCPVSVVINKNDMFTKNYNNAEKLWSRYSAKNIKVYFVESESHYFQSDNAKELFEIMKDII